MLQDRWTSALNRREWLAAGLACLLPNPTRADIPEFSDLLLKPMSVRKGERHLFFTADELSTLRKRAAADPAFTKIASKLRGLENEPVGKGHPDLDKSGTQYQAGYALVELGLAHLISPQPQFLRAARLWINAVISWSPWGYTFRTPNEDLPPAFLLYGLATAYSVFKDEIEPKERKAARIKLAYQAKFIANSFAYRPKRRYTWSQNHTYIPISGLGMAALALIEEEPDAPLWAKLARAVFERTRDTFSTDGYFFEGFHYAVFTNHWIIRFLDAWYAVTGEDLYPGWRPHLQPLKYFYAHSVLPDGRWSFDFGDTGNGSKDRLNEKRGALNTGHEVLYRLASVFNDAESQTVADHHAITLKTKTEVPLWSWISRDPSLKPAPMANLATSRHFEDHGMAYWRSGWDRNATAIAFRCGPPEGYRAIALQNKMPDWRFNQGHAHPDAGAFIVYGAGRYLTGTAGYTGIKRTAEQNTILIDGKGQAGEGKHEWAESVPPEKLAGLKLAIEKMGPAGFVWTADAAAAYPDHAKLKQFKRTLKFDGAVLEVTDELESADPRVFTWVLNGDEKFEDLGQGSYRLAIGNAVLKVQRAEPTEADAKIEPLQVIARGRPGSVEKGVAEQRGYQLRVSTAPVARVKFVHRLQWEVRLS
jgi:hypothetical protein